ncbi:MAG: hypothetical protein VX537_01225, partial [Candidatus Neomarinimicrobiota bacterium]|nr:hypothetical protein [Candidatus Neomarinimicrobiota bacterium]
RVAIKFDFLDPGYHFYSCHLAFLKIMLQARTLPEGSWTCVSNLIRSFGKSCLFHFIVRSSHLICAGLDSRLVRP